MRGSPVLLANFGGGVNKDVGPYHLKDSEARDARNVISTPRGAVRKRDGNQQFATPAVALTSLFASNSPTALMIGSDGSTIYSIAANGTITTIGTGHTVGSLWEWIQAPPITGQGPFYGVNRNQAVQWTGSGSTAAWTATTGTVPVGKYIAYHGTRVWVANTAAEPSAVYWSNIGNPRDWPAANITKFDPNDGEEITGLAVVGPYLLVFKPSKTWLIYDLDTSANRRLGQGVGCASHRSIAAGPNGTYFLSKDQGVMRTDGNSLREVSRPLRPTLEAISPAARAQAAGIFFGGRYYLSVSETGITNTLMLDFDDTNDAWWLHTIGVQQLAAWERTAGQPELYGAVSGAARVDRLFVPGATTDPTGVFNAYWSGPFHTFGKPAKRKRVRQIHFDGKGRIQISLSKDFASSPSLAGEARFAGSGGTFGGEGVFGGAGIYGGTLLVSEARVFTPGVARAWSVTFGNETEDEFEVDSMTIAVQERAN